MRNLLLLLLLLTIVETTNLFYGLNLGELALEMFTIHVQQIRERLIKSTVASEMQ